MKKRPEFTLMTKKILLLVLIAGALFFLFPKTESFNLQKYLDKCDANETQAATVCWKEIIEESLEKESLDNTFEILAVLYDTEPSFQAICHDYVHIIGKKAYSLFEEGRDFKISPKTSYCAYGFYHGFMESMVSKSGDVAEARRFCEYVDAQLSSETANANLACYHGIGHGWTNVHDEKLWGQEQAMIDPAIELCEKVTEDPEERKICVTGIFDSISIGYYNEAYGLKIRKEDPYWLCKIQKEVYKQPCYMDLSPAVLWLGDNQLSGSLRRMGKVEDKYRELVTKTLAENSVRYILNSDKKFDDEIILCRSLKAGEGKSCMEGLASGYLQFGEPGREIESAMIFCNDPVLSPDEKEKCKTVVLRNYSLYISGDRYRKFCSDLGDEGRFCLK
jgi:hypothetical protein